MTTHDETVKSKIMSLAEEHDAEVTDYVNYAYGDLVAVFDEEALISFADAIRKEESDRLAKRFVKWDGKPHAATDTVWIEPGRLIKDDE